MNEFDPYANWQRAPRGGPHHTASRKLGVAVEWIVGLSIVGLLLFVIIGGLAQMEWGTEHNATFTVQSLDDQASGSTHKYLVFATDGQVYENTDSWLHGKTDSSNVWAMFLANPHGTFTCPVYGYRSTFLSSYPDILDGCKLVTVPVGKLYPTLNGKAPLFQQLTG